MVLGTKPEVPIVLRITKLDKKTRGLKIALGESKRGDFLCREGHVNQGLLKSFLVVVI